jgi:aryl-alcohol dehydrogenase-like predicted oxidoreductase
MPLSNWAATCSTWRMAMAMANAARLWHLARAHNDQLILQTRVPTTIRIANVTPFDITADIHDSLARLKVDYVVSIFCTTMNRSQWADCRCAERTTNRARSVPLVAQLERPRQEANDYAAANGLKPFVISSNNFSLAPQIKAPWDRCVSISNVASEMEFYRRTQMPLLPWSSLAGGFFSGRFRRDNVDTFTEYLDKLCVECYCSEENFERLDRAEKMAAEKGVSVTQIAMAYIITDCQSLRIDPGRSRRI